MKALYKKILPYILSLEILFMSFFSCSITVRASDFVARDIIEAVEYGIEFNDWNPFWDFLYSSGDGLVYMLSQMGAFVTKDFVKWVNNNRALESLVETVPVPAKKEENNIVFTVEFMTQLKQLLDDYAVENQPFTLQKTYKMTDISPNYFHAKVVYDYFKSFFDSDSYEYIILSVSGGSGHIADVASVIKEGGCFYTVNPGDSLVRMLSPDWSIYRASTYKFGYKYDPNSGYSLNVSDAEDYRRFEYFHKYDAKRTDFSKNYSLFTKDGGNIRVFNSRSDFINYSVGQRKIYYTSEYYNYVPEDLQVSIDDLQKTIDDMQDVIDKLLDQITNNTSESEIEELLRQILEELKNNQGGSSGGDGGGGSGGGDVNVDIDLGATNSWLSKIYTKVSQIFEKMNVAVEDAEQSALAKIQESLDEIIVQLKKIKHWTVAGTVIDAADAVADWADLLLGILKDAKEGAGSAVASIAATVGDSVDMMAQKFPFSVPWDILLFVSLLSAEPQMPYFEIPFNVELSMLDITIDYTMKLDFSQLQWLSDLSRLLLSMTYAVGLLKMTAGITSVGKEE